MQRASHESHRAPLAPRWHTAALVALIVGVAALGALMPRAAGAASARASVGVAWVYLSMIVVPWSLAVYAWRVGRSHSALRALLGVGWSRASRVAGDLALALVTAFAVCLVELVWTRLTSSATPAAVTAMLPHTTPERLMWVAVAVSAGFCEEVVFRGYLQTQLAACGRGAAVGVASQAVLFAIAHGEQGLSAAARAGFYGLLLGVLAWRRRSLAPGIVAHIGLDLAAGLGGG